MDITHYVDKHYLMLIDCGPAHFSVLQLLLWQGSTSVIHQLVLLFYNWSTMPYEVLSSHFEDEDECDHSQVSSESGKVI